MKKVKKITVCILSLLLLNAVRAQIINRQPQNSAGMTGAYRAVHWGLDEGLSNGIVNSLLQDQNGFLWIATDFGLNRFDGYTFKKYYADKNKGNKTITGNTVRRLIEDSLHNIWIGSDRGLSWYDIKADTFRNFPASKTVVPFWATKHEVFSLVYTGMAEMLIRTYNIHSFSTKDVGKIVYADSLGYAYSDQSAIYDEGSHSVWMQKGLHSWPGGGLMQISITDGRKKTYTWSCFRKIPNHSHWTEGMCLDHRRNSIWISSPDGLVEFTLRDKKFHPVDAMNEFTRKKEFHNWAGIDIDMKGRIWMGTIPEGIIIFDPEINSLSIPFSHDPAEQKNVSDGNLTIYCARNNMVWSVFWSGKGISQLIPFSPSLRRFEVSSGFCINGYGGNLWLPTLDGIKIFDPYTSSFSLLSKKELGFKDEFLRPIKVDSSSKKAWIQAWVPPDGRPFEIDLNSKKTYPIFFEESHGRYVSYDSLKFDRPFALIPSPFKNGVVYLATFTDHQAIFVLKNNERIARKILTFPVLTLNKSKIYTDDEHRIFLRTSAGPTNLTYTYRNGSWACTPTRLDSIQWSQILYHKPDSTYWVVAETEIAHYDKDFKLIRGYTQEDDLPGIRINEIIPDKNGNIWFNTERSLHQLNVKTGTIMKFSEKDGFLSKNLEGLSGVKGNDDEIYFVLPHESHLYAINPDKLLSSSSLIYLRSLAVNQKPFPIATGLNNLDELSLRYFENTITLETGSLDYYSKGKNNFRYKLETNGESAAWQYAPVYYTIRYEGLSPGKHKLMLQASNASNEFNGPVKTLLINISPAFWNTWWFRTMALIFLVDIIYSFVQWRTKEKFKLRLERSEKEKQLAELQQQKTELEMQALRAQMNPHFIFNSLNSINRFILQNNRTQASEYLTKFSKLVRLILQNSQASLISLENELEALNLYLDLEALRFDHRFGYKISVPKDLDIEVLKVPPLIIQPYTENAIWHGLMHKEEKGQLDVEVSQEDEYLFFKITDNGIGRKKAAELASKSATKHKSMGLRITKERIAMMQKTNGNESPVNIIDLENVDGSAAGTEVIIKMPALYD